MATLTADPLDVSGTQNYLGQFEGLGHIRVRKRGALLILESGPADDPHAHARLRRVTKQWWTLEMPTHTGRWQKTPLRAPRNEVLDTLINSFGWTLQPVD